MDPVSRMLSERESSRPLLAPFVILAVLLHGGLAGAVFVMARGVSARPAHLPVVSVKFVRPEPRITASRPQEKTSTQPAAKQKPKATPVPEVKATAVPTRKPKPVSTSPPAHSASADAMAAIDATPPPTRPPRSGDGSSQQRASGLSLGGGGTSRGEASGIPSDFQFTYYINRMLSLIESHWYKPPAPAGTKARARFRILKSGAIEAVSLEESSGIPSFDRAVLRALYATNPLPPLPPTYAKTSLTVHLTFSE